LIVVAEELIFIVEEAEEGGYFAHALGHGIVTQGEDLADLRAMILDATAAYFHQKVAPPIIRLHFVRDEVIAFNG
jgi:hypothetical protein